MGDTIPSHKNEIVYVKLKLTVKLVAKKKT